MSGIIPPVGGALKPDPERVPRPGPCGESRPGPASAPESDSERVPHPAPGRRFAWARVLFWLTLTLCMWLYAACGARDAAAGGRALQLRGLTLSRDMAETLRERETQAERPAAFTLWTRERAKLLKNPALERSTRVGLLLVDGDSALAFPVGVTLPAGDRRGILLDRSSAFALFGDANPVGGRLEWEGKEYIVRGVFPAPRATAVIQGGHGTIYTAAALLGGDTAGFAARHGLEEPISFPAAAFGQWAVLFAALPAWRGAWALFAALLRERARQRAFPVRRGLLLFSAVLFAWGALRLLAGTVPDLTGLLPTRWSDFEFWARAFDGWRAQAAELVMFAKGAPDLLLLVPTAKAALGGIAACLCLGRAANVSAS